MTDDDDALTCEGCQIRAQDRDRLRVLANRLMDDNDRNHRIIDRVCAARDDALRKLAELEESVVTKEAATTAAEAVAWAEAELEGPLAELRSEVATLRDDLGAARADADRYKADAISTAGTVAAMHAAAVGEIRGPIRGVVEDVQDVRTCWLLAEKRIKELEELPATVAAIREQITVVTGPPPPADSIVIHPSVARDVEDWLQAHGYRWLWTGSDGNTLLLCRPGQWATMARIGDRLRWTGNRVRVEAR